MNSPNAPRDETLADALPAAAATLAAHDAARRALPAYDPLKVRDT